MNAPILPERFNILAEQLHSEFNFKNILLFNSVRTGDFIDRLFLGCEQVTRVKYRVKDWQDGGIFRSHVSYVIREQVQKLNKKFDFICMDPYHEYKESSEDFKLLLDNLSDSGILICHDCKPPSKRAAHSTDIPEEWCGVTYAAFIEAAYNNPDFFYALIDKHYGLGIISKIPMSLVTKDLNRGLQECFLKLFKVSTDHAYDFFKLHAKEMINLVC
jgi:hypothetical protein